MGKTTPFGIQRGIEIPRNIIDKHPGYMRQPRENIWTLGHPLNEKKTTYKIYKNPGQDFSACNFVLPSTGEFLLDTNVAYGPAFFDQVLTRSNSIAFDGTNYLVVWEEYRSDPDSSDIWGTRISQDGTVLDPAGFPISTAGGGQAYPSIAFDGTNYLVVWIDERNDSYYKDIYGTRVSKSGTVLDPTGIAISTSGYAEDTPCVIWGSDDYFVTWMEFWGSYGYHILGTRVSPDGTILNPGGIPISNVSGNKSGISGAFDGTNYFLVWRSNQNDTPVIYGTRISKTGTVLNTSGIQISSKIYDAVAPSVAFDGINYLVTWTDLKAYNYNIYGSRVNKSGVILDTSAIPISTTIDDQFFSSIAFDGTNYLVVWGDSRGNGEVYGTRINKSGVVLDTQGIILSPPNATKWGSPSSIAFGDANYFLVWENEINYEYDVCGTRIDTSGKALDTSGIIVSTAAYSQWLSSTAFGGTNYLSVYYDSRNNGSVYATRLDSSGNVLDPTGILISSTTTDYYYPFAKPAVAFDGTNYLTVWSDDRNGEDNSDIYGVRVSPAGNTLGEFPISTLPGWKAMPSVAFGGNNYFAVWYSDSIPRLRGARITPSGTVLDPQGITIDNYGQYASIGFDGTNYFVSYAGVLEDSSYYEYGVCASIIDTTGTVLNKIFVSPSLSPYSLAFDGKNYLILGMLDITGMGENSDIYGIRVTSGGVVLDTTPIFITGNSWDERYCSACFDGTNFVIVWEDFRNGMNNSDIYGCSMDTSGKVVNRFLVTNQTGYQLFPTLTKGPGAQLLTTYSGWTPAPYNTIRVWGKLSPFIGVEETSNSDFGLRSADLKIGQNPFIRSTIISYKIPANFRSRLTNTRLTIYDLTGRCVKTLVDGEKEAGSYSISLNAKELKTGVYFVRLDAGTFKATKKITVIR